VSEADGVPRVTRVAAYALCTDRDAILLCRIAPGSTTSDDGFWTLPGGGLDFGEQPAAAALRELDEETGLLGEVIGLAGVDSWSKRFLDPEDGVTKHMHGVRVIYHVQVTGGELRDEPGGSTDTCRWVPRHELSSLQVVDLVNVGVGLAFAERAPTNG
jgi:ADP-ribose pyrophosphatase YjhB (NUDIX family)